MTRIRLPFINAFRDRHGKTRHYFRRGGKRAPLPGLPGSEEFMAAYQAALTGVTIRKKQIGEERTVPGTLQALIAAYLDCSPCSTSPFKALAAETQRTRRNILENMRVAHGEKTHLPHRSTGSPRTRADPRACAAHGQSEEHYALRSTKLSQYSARLV